MTNAMQSAGAEDKESVLDALIMCDYLIVHKDQEEEIDDDEDQEAETDDGLNPFRGFRGGSARQYLDWLILNGFTDAQTEKNATLGLIGELRARTIYAYMLAPIRLIQGLDPRLSDALAQYDRQTQRRTMAWLGAAAAVMVGGILFFSYFVSSPSACNAKSVRNTLFTSLFRATHTYGSETPSLRVKNETEVSYDRSAGLRACTAELTEDGKSTSERIGYLVSKDKVQILPLEYVITRYASAAQNKKLGAPVGRDAMRAAVMERFGQIKISLGAPPYSPRPFPNGKIQKAPTDRIRQQSEAENIGAVLPTADCRPVAEGRYSCPAQVEYRDRLMDVLSEKSSPFRMLEMEFLFEQYGGVWREVSMEFDEKFFQAVRPSRFERLRPHGKTDG